VPTSQSRVLPIASVDAGAVFEREMEFAGRNVVHTLEPRASTCTCRTRPEPDPDLRHVTADFNYAQIFSENAYLGWDRFMNANQMTLAVTSRLIVPRPARRRCAA